jgi:hypothetical protein
MKLVFNLALQGGAVGDQDATTPCPDGGSAHVYGTASSNSVEGATMVDLTYDFSSCAYHDQDTDPTKTFSVTLNGRATEKGTLAVQPSATTAILFASDALDVNGTVYDPAMPYAAAKCPVHATQDGNAVTGTICGRDGSFSF